MKNSDNLIFPANKYPFLRGGGEMGSLIRAKDWNKTSLGSPEFWPQSLRTTLSIMLNSKFPMFLFWGPELICFYNDAYRPSLGNEGKHPSAVGLPGEIVWPEIWAVIKPLIDQVLGGGEATWSEDQLIPIYRNGKLEDVYWTFSYSPVCDETGKPFGVFVTCSETTSAVLTTKKLEESKDQLQFAIESAELATWDYNPATNKFTSNDRLKDWFVLKDEHENDLQQTINSIAEKDHGLVTRQIQQSLQYTSGGKLDIEFTVIHPSTFQERILRAKGRAWFDDNKIGYRLNGTVQDITEQAIALKQIEESEHRFRYILEKALDPILIFKGENMVLEIANEPLFKLWGIDKNALGKPFLEILPEMKEQGFFDMLQDVYFNDKIIKGTETPVFFIRPDGTKEVIYFNFTYQPYREEDGKITGVLVIASDVTRQVEAKKRVEESEEQLRIALEGGELGTFDYFPLENKLLWSAKTKELFGLPPDAPVNFDLYMQALHPEDRNTSQAIAQQKLMLQNGGLYDIEYRTIGISDGRVRWVRSKGIATYDVNNNPVRYTGVVQEITQRKEAELALKESEERFRSLANNMAAFIFTGDADTNVDFVNRQWLEFVGLKSEEGLGKAWATVTHPDDVAPMTAIYTKAVVDHKPYEFEIRQQNRSGEYCWVLWKGVPRITSNGTFGGMIGVGIDITDRKKTEQALHNQQVETEKLQRLYEAVTGNTPDLVYIFDLNYRFTYANPALLTMWGKTWEEAVGKSLLENGYEPWHAEMHEQEIDEIILTKKPIRGTVSFPHAELGKRIYDYIFAPVLNSEGNVEAIAGTTRDITDITTAEEDLLKSEQQMRAMVETAPFPIGVYIGGEMIIQFANQSILNAWGKGNDVIGKSFKQILPELDNQDVFKQLDEVYTTGVPYHKKNQKIDLVIDGETKCFYFNYSFTPLTDSNGKVYGVMNTAADVTDLNLAKLAIQKSEENLRSTILQAPVAMCFFKGENFIVDLSNEKMFELWGKTADDVMYKPIFEGLPEAKDQGFEAILQGVYTTGKTFSAHGVPINLPRNGAIELVYVNFVYEPYREADGIISGILAVAVDVTPQLTASKKIEEREQKFRLLADSMPQHIWTADTDGNLNYYNQSVYDYSGLTPQQIDKDGWIQIVHPDDREENIKAWIHAVTTGTDFHFEHRFQRYDGVYRWQLSRAVPQRDAEGNIQMWVGTSTDIQEIKEMDQQKDDFISIASHEMKTPLTTAKGYLQLLLLVLSKENQTAFLYVNKANQAVERLHNLVVELLDASKIQNGQLNYNISTFDFNAMADETIENMQHTATNHRIQKTGTILHTITGDKDRLQQVLINLLSNAIKYSPNADNVLIKVEEQPGKIQVSVQDFGVGMSPHHLDKIFNRYYRVQEHAAHFQGLGIGLYLSSNIIQRHNGTMWADSEPGKGSTFYFTLPL